MIKVPLMVVRNLEFLVCNFISDPFSTSGNAAGPGQVEPGYL